MLGYDVQDEDRDFSKDGLTGTVTRYTKENLKYPCYIVSPPFEKYKITVLKSMFSNSESYSEELSNLMINLYFEENGRKVGLGRIAPLQVKSFLRLFDGNDIVGFYDENTVLKGDNLYALGGL